MKNLSLPNFNKKSTVNFVCTVEGLQQYVSSSPPHKSQNQGPKNDKSRIRSLIGPKNYKSLVSLKLKVLKLKMSSRIGPERLQVSNEFKDLSPKN